MRTAALSISPAIGPTAGPFEFGEAAAIAAQIKHVQAMH
jgi:hypothetical protein